MDNKGLAVHNDGMTGIIPTLKTDHDISKISQKIDYLALAFISPLSANNDHICHIKSSVALS